MSDGAKGVSNQETRVQTKSASGSYKLVTISILKCVVPITLCERMICGYHIHVRAR